MTLAGAVRIGGEGEASPRSTADDRRARLALADQWLDERAAGDGGVVIIEIDRDGDSFGRVDRFRHNLMWPAPDDLVIDFLRIGVLGSVGAAEYVRNTLGTGVVTIYATHNPHPFEPDQARVLYDSCVPSYFRPDTVVPLDTIRRLAHGYALHGDWPQDVPGRPHDDLVTA